MELFDVEQTLHCRDARDYHVSTDPLVTRGSVRREHVRTWAKLDTLRCSFTTSQPQRHSIKVLYFARDIVTHVPRITSIIEKCILQIISLSITWSVTVSICFIWRSERRPMANNLIHPVIRLEKKATIITSQCYSWWLSWSLTPRHTARKKGDEIVGVNKLIIILPSRTSCHGN